MSDNGGNITREAYQFSDPEEEKEARGNIEILFGKIMEELKMDITDPSIEETPRRVTDVLMSLGSIPFPKMTVFTEKDADSMVTVSCQAASLCEHHFLPFFGRVYVGYIPNNGRVIGLSKIPRIIQHYAWRPQLQERLVSQVAGTLMEELQPMGVGVYAEMVHTCMSIRGPKATGSLTQTTALKGNFLSEASVKQEFMDSITREKLSPTILT